MAFRASGSAEENLFAPELLLGGFGRIQAPESVELGSRRQADDGHEIAHFAGVAPVEMSTADFRQEGRVAIEVFFDLREVIQAAHGALGAEELRDSCAY